MLQLTILFPALHNCLGSNPFLKWIETWQTTIQIRPSGQGCEIYRLLWMLSCSSRIHGLGAVECNHAEPHVHMSNRFRRFCQNPARCSRYPSPRVSTLPDFCLLLCKAFSLSSGLTSHQPLKTSDPENKVLPVYNNWKCVVILFVFYIRFQSYTCNHAFNYAFDFFHCTPVSSQMNGRALCVVAEERKACIIIRSYDILFH